MIGTSGQLHLGAFYSAQLQINEDGNITTRIRWPWVSSSEVVVSNFSWYELLELPVWINRDMRDVSRLGTIESCNFQDGLGTITIKPTSNEAAIKTLKYIEKGRRLGLEIKITYRDDGTDLYRIKPLIVGTIGLPVNPEPGKVDVLI